MWGCVIERHLGLPYRETCVFPERHLHTCCISKHMSRKILLQCWVWSIVRWSMTLLNRPLHWGTVRTCLVWKLAQCKQLVLAQAALQRHSVHRFPQGYGLGFGCAKLCMRCSWTSQVRRNCMDWFHHPTCCIANGSSRNQTRDPLDPKKVGPIQAHCAHCVLTCTEKQRMTQPVWKYPLVLRVMWVYWGVRNTQNERVKWTHGSLNQRAVFNHHAHRKVMEHSPASDTNWPLYFVHQYYFQHGIHNYDHDLHGWHHFQYWVVFWSPLHLDCLHLIIWYMCSTSAVVRHLLLSAIQEFSCLVHLIWEENEAFFSPRSVFLVPIHSIDLASNHMDESVIFCKLISFVLITTWLVWVYEVAPWFRGLVALLWNVQVSTVVAHESCPLFWSGHVDVILNLAAGNWSEQNRNTGENFHPHW